MGFPGGSDDRQSACNIGDWGPISGLGRSSGEGNGNHSSITAWRIPWTEEREGYRVENSRAQLKQLSTQARAYDPEGQSL